MRIKKGNGGRTWGDWGKHFLHIKYFDKYKQD